MVSRYAAAKSAGPVTTRMPRPPPPADALMITGYPIPSASARASAAEPSDSRLPGSIGSPARCISARAAVLSPSRAITSGGGPMKTSPLSRHTSAKSAFSDRNP